MKTKSFFLVYLFPHIILVRNQWSFVSSDSSKLRLGSAKNISLSVFTTHFVFSVHSNFLNCCIEYFFDLVSYDRFYLVDTVTVSL